MISAGKVTSSPASAAARQQPCSPARPEPHPSRSCQLIAGCCSAAGQRLLCPPTLPSPSGPRRPPCSRGARKCTARRRSPRPRGRSRPPRPGRLHGLPSSTSPPPTPVPQKTPSSELYGLARRRGGTPRRSRPARRCRARTAQPKALFERRPEREAALPAGQVARARDGAALDRARRADADARERLRVDARFARRVAQRRLHLRGHVRGPAARGRAAPRRAAHLAALVDDHRLDLRAAEIDPAVVGHLAMMIADAPGVQARVWTRRDHGSDPRCLASCV